MEAAVVHNDAPAETARGFCFDFEGTRHATSDPRVTPQEIRKIVGNIEENVPIVQVLEDGTQVTLSEGQEVQLVQCVRFRRLPRFIRGRNRIDADVALLRSELPGAILGSNDEYVLVPEFALPHGVFVQSLTTLLVVLPPTYPAASPTNFHVTWGLALADGRTISNYSGPAALYGQHWGTFSFRLDAATWHPGDAPERGDNLLTFLTAVRARLQEGA